MVPYVKMRIGLHIIKINIIITIYLHHSEINKCGIGFKPPLFFQKNAVFHHIDFFGIPISFLQNFLCWFSLHKEFDNLQMKINNWDRVFLQSYKTGMFEDASESKCEVWDS